jgi:hypothetical protein
MVSCVRLAGDAAQARLAESPVIRPRRGYSRLVPEFKWDVHLPGADLPHRIATDYLVSDGEKITIGGREWVVERVELAEEIEDAVGLVWVVPRAEP